MSSCKQCMLEHSSQLSSRHLLAAPAWHLFWWDHWLCLLPLEDHPVFADGHPAEISSPCLIWKCFPQGLSFLQKDSLPGKIHGTLKQVNRKFPAEAVGYFIEGHCWMQSGWLWRATHPSIRIITHPWAFVYWVGWLGFRMRQEGEGEAWDTLKKIQNGTPGCQEAGQGHQTQSVKALKLNFPRVQRPSRSEIANSLPIGWIWPQTPFLSSSQWFTTLEEVINLEKHEISHKIWISGLEKVGSSGNGYSHPHLATVGRSWVLLAATVDGWMLYSLPQAPPLPVVSFHHSQWSIQHWLSHLTPGQRHPLLHLIGNHYKINHLLCSSFSFVKYWLFCVQVILVYMWYHAVYFIFLLCPSLSTRPFMSILLLCVHTPVALDGCVVLPGGYPHLTSPFPVWTPILPPALRYHKECCHEQHPCICPLTTWWGNFLVYTKEQKHWVEGFMDSSFD